MTDLTLALVSILISVATITLNIWCYYDLKKINARIEAIQVRRT